MENTGAAKNNKLGEKKLKKCAKIIGVRVLAGYCNGELPHGVVLAVAEGNNLFFVHLKKGKAINYCVNGNFVMKKLKGPIKIWHPFKTQDEQLAAAGRKFEEEVQTEIEFTPSIEDMREFEVQFTPTEEDIRVKFTPHGAGWEGLT